jgi:hypothetical protein
MELKLIEEINLKKNVSDSIPSNRESYSNEIDEK